MYFIGLSGGLSSTYALWDLVERGADLKTHHVMLTCVNERYASPDRTRRQAAEDRRDAAAAAVKKIAAWFAKRGHDIDLSMVSLDLGNHEFHLSRLENLLLPLLINWTCVKKPEGDHRIIWGSHKHRYPDDDDGAHLWEIMTSLVHNCRTGATEPQVRRYGSRSSRAEQIKRMPDELVKLTMNCRHPKMIRRVWVPCGSTKEHRTRWTDRGTNWCRCAELNPLLERYRKGWHSRASQSR